MFDPIISVLVIINVQQMISLVVTSSRSATQKYLFVEKLKDDYEMTGVSASVQCVLVHQRKRLTHC